MVHDWKDLTEITKGEAIKIKRVELKESGIFIDGDFELPPLAQLTIEDQIFAAAFIRCQGSIKDMEELFGISYPTVKNRLQKISEKLEFVEIDPPIPKNEILEQLDKGKISVEDAVRILGGKS